MKRFYDAVDVRQEAGGWQVTLDGRGIRTVKGSQQVAPTETLARLMASEWDVQGEELDPAQFPFRDMADYAIDIVAPDPSAVADKVVTYGDTDTLLYRADPDEPLFARQQEVWEPLVSAFENRLGIELIRVSGIIHKSQSETALGTLRERLAGHDPFTLAPLEAMTSLAASLVVGLSAIDSEKKNGRPISGAAIPKPKTAARSVSAIS